MNPYFSRRDVLKSTACGFGYLAFASLNAWAAEKAISPLAPKKPHFPARAERVIFLCMDGAPSHVDTFDYKPKLTADTGKAFGKGRLAAAKLLGSPWKFSRHGKSGLWISELFPNVARHADELCLLRGMHTDVPAHPQAFVQMHTGISQFPRPSMGAWTLYGLGSENDSLPGFITLCPPVNNGGPLNYGSSFLPAVYQGTRIGFGNRPVTDAKVNNIANPSQTGETQRVQLDFLESLNRTTLDRETVHAGVEGLIESFELAFRMQSAMPHVMDVSKETKSIHEQYGIDDAATDGFGRQCLLARRFAEAGVRFIEIGHPGWDQHRNLKTDLARNCMAVDKPIAGLLADLKARGMLKDTLVIWGGEFGRTPTAQNGDGRDHNAAGFTMWMAGAGVKAGFSYGQTDDYGFEAVEGKIHIHDWHATILHLLGLDHEKLTYRHAGREMRLTDIKGTVVKDIFA